MKVKSILKDERIDAYNALVEISVGEYLNFAKNVIDNNEFQRKKVIKSKIKEILKEDLLRNCLIPSIVLAVTSESIETIKNEDDFINSEKIINESIEQRDILIIDGLQRTYVLMNLEEDLIKGNKLDELIKFHTHKIRAEIYLGLNRVGLLYRMITLNTGQTTMSTRHLMEILYLDYSRLGIDGIQLTKDKDDSAVIESTQEFSFKTILDGFNSYLEKNEALIERTEILDNIRSLDVLKREEENKDLFKNFLTSYKNLLDLLLAKSNHWQYDTTNIEHTLNLNTNPFGKSVLDIFKKSQVLTGLGAALGHLREKSNIDLTDFDKIAVNIIAENEDWNLAFCQLLKHLDLIKEKSKKIGNDQRYFFKHFFRSLINPNSDSYLDFNRSSVIAYNITRDDKDYK